MKTIDKVGRLGIFVMAFLFLIVLSCPVLLAQQMTVQDLLDVPPTSPDHRIAYGDDPHQFGQLRLPKGQGLFPVVIVIHGCCLLSQYDLHHISPLAAEITKMGFATWSLEYRRVGNDGGGWPGTFQDVADGSDHLKKLAQEFPLDLNRVITIGHSAGGHLALWVAARHKIPEKALLYKKNPLPIRGVVALAAVGSLNLPNLQEICGGGYSEIDGGNTRRCPG